MSVKWSRRRLLRYAALFSSLQAVGFRKPALEPPPPGERYRGERPNVVLIVVDDLAAGVVGQGSRFPLLETLHISRLEAEGVSFPQAFMSTAVCSPSRASLLTGTYAPRGRGWVSTPG